MTFYNFYRFFTGEYSVSHNLDRSNDKQLQNISLRYKFKLVYYLIYGVMSILLFIIPVITFLFRYVTFNQMVNEKLGKQ